MTLALLLLCAFTVAFAMVANRVSKTMLTAPMLFIAFGYLLSQTGLVDGEHADEALHVVAEIALIILLFLDAAQTDLNALRRDRLRPVRMLVIGVPMAIILGTAMMWSIAPNFPLVALALMAAIMAPTDAALGQAVVTNPVVPAADRRTLTVESGLNDGLALPAVLFFASLTADASGSDDTNWLFFAFTQLTLGPLVGIVAGIGGGKLFLWAKDRNLTGDTYEGIGAISLALGAYLGATLIDGNGFIAAFIGGLCFGNVVKGRCKFVYEFAESEGQILTWGAFFLLGLALVSDALEHLSLTMLAIILLSLFVVRPLAIWISLIGTKTPAVTRLFFGWFGPRGLATALFTLLVVHEISAEYGEHVLALAINTVWISALLHGLSAVPGAKWYAARVKRENADTGG